MEVFFFTEAEHHQLIGKLEETKTMLRHARGNFGLANSKLTVIKSLSARRSYALYGVVYYRVHLLRATIISGHVHLTYNPSYSACFFS
jgi:hypothetical protein